MVCAGKVLVEIYVKTNLFGIAIQGGHDKRGRGGAARQGLGYQKYFQTKERSHIRLIIIIPSYSPINNNYQFRE